MAENTSRARALTFSSEYRVQRWFGVEILDHDSKSVRMDFMKSGRAPLLMGHDQRIVVGIIESARIDSKEKKGRASARFSRSAFADEKLRDVDDGILVNVSAGYRVHEMVLEKQTEHEDTYRITDWEPLEASLVGIPADPSVGMGRSQDTPEVETREAKPATAEPPADVTTVERTPATAVQEIRMSEATQTAVKVDPVKQEQERIAAIEAFGKASNIDSRTIRGWIDAGTPLERTFDKDGEELPSVSQGILQVMEARGKERPTAASNLGLTRGETQRYSLFRALRAMAYGAQQPKLIEEAAFEIECTETLVKQLGSHQRASMNSILIPGEILARPLGISAEQQAQRQMALRAMSTTPGSKGGYLVAVENMGFIDILRNRSVAMNMGARVLSGLQGNVTFPRQTGKVTVTWQGGEGTSVTAADQALGQLSATPKTAIAITDVSEQLLRQSNPSAESFVMNDLASDVAIDGVDAATINGTGGAQPLGIKNTTGVTTGQDAAALTYAKALAFPVAAGGSNAIRGNPGWVTNIAGAAIAMQKQRFTSTDSPLWEGNLLDGQLVGFRAMSSEQIASGNLIFGSWDELVICEWGVLELALDNGGTRFNQAQVGIRAMWMVDVLLRYPQAFVVSTSLSA